MIKAILLKELRKIIKDRGTFIYLLGMPMAFMVLFHFMFSQDRAALSLRVFDADRSALSQQYVKLLGQAPGIEITELNGSLTDIQQQVAKGKSDSAIVIPEGFAAGISKQQPVQIVIFAGPKALSSAAAVSSVLEHTGQQFANPNRPHDLIQVTTEQAGGAQAFSLGAQIVPGYTVMFVFYIMINILRSMFKERDLGVLERIRSTPLTAFQYMLGMWLPQVIASMIQIGTLFLFGHLLLNLQLHDYGLLFLLSLALSLCATALGLAITMLVKSENQGMAYVQLLSLGGAALGGLWVPLEQLPAGIRSIAHALPQYWAMQGYQALLQTGNTQILWNGIAVLSAIAAGAVAIAATRYNQFARAE